MTALLLRLRKKNHNFLIWALKLFDLFFKKKIPNLFPLSFSFFPVACHYKLVALYVHLQFYTLTQTVNSEFTSNIGIWLVDLVVVDACKHYQKAAKEPLYENLTLWYFQA